jgi:orotate phosphoribosyltransferase
MMKTNRRIAEYLLQSKAIILEPASPFTWASGWKSPIYCDNRKTLSFPDIRTSIRDAYIECIHENFEIPEVIAGVATGAVAQGALVAEAMKLPFIYVRSSAKDHGTQNLIEGSYREGQRVLIIEDLISTGGSSLKAVDALRTAGCEVIGMVATFTYGFRESQLNFEKKNISVKTLTDYDTMLEQALQHGYIKNDQLPVLQNWRINPSSWNPR